MWERILHDSLTFNYLKKEVLARGFGFERVKEGVIPLHRVIKDQGPELFIFGSNRYPDMSILADYVTTYKSVMQELLVVENVPMPKFQVVNKVDDVRKWLAEGGNFEENLKNGFVLKPINGSLGKMVSFHRSLDEVEQLVEKIESLYGNCLVQEWVHGEDIRVQVVGGRFFAACRRAPANVTGDGVFSIKQLIEEKNLEKAKISMGNLIKVDDVVLNFLDGQGLSLDSVVERGRQVFLRTASNIGLGGDPIDITEEINEEYVQFVERVAKLINAKTFAVDFIALDYRKPFRDGGANFIEANVPCIWAHHHFAQGKKRNVAAAILDYYIDPMAFNSRDGKYVIL